MGAYTRDYEQRRWYTPKRVKTSSGKVIGQFRCKVKDEETWHDGVRGYLVSVVYKEDTYNGSPMNRWEICLRDTEGLHIVQANVTSQFCKSLMSQLSNLTDDQLEGQIAIEPWVFQSDKTDDKGEPVYLTMASVYDDNKTKVTPKYKTKLTADDDATKVFLYPETERIDIGGGQSVMNRTKLIALFDQEFDALNKRIERINGVIVDKPQSAALAGTVLHDEDDVPQEIPF